MQFMADLIAPETQLAMTGGRFDESQARTRGRTSVSGWTCSQGVGSRVSGPGSRVSTGSTTGRGEGTEVWTGSNTAARFDAR